MFKQVIQPIVAFVVVGAVLIADASAKERTFSPIAGDGQEVRFSDGRAVLATGNTLGNLAVTYYPLDKKSAYLLVWVENASELQFNFAETSLTASSGGSPLTVLTYDDRVKAQKRKEFWAGFWTAVAAGANSYNASQAGYSSTSASYYGRSSGSISGSHGYANYSGSSYGTYYSTSYSAGAAYWAQADAAVRNEAMFDRYQGMVQEARKNLQQVSLKANTLLPGQSVLGTVQLDLPKAGKGGPAEFAVQVNLGGSPLQLLFREGPPVIDQTPHAVAVGHPVGPSANGQSNRPEEPAHFGVSSPVVQGSIGSGTSEYVPGVASQAAAPRNNPVRSPAPVQVAALPASPNKYSSNTTTGRFTGVSVLLPAGASGAKKLNCEYDTGHGKTVWHSSYGACPQTW